MLFVQTYYRLRNAKSKVLTRKSPVNSLVVLKDNCLSNFSFAVHYTHLKKGATESFAGLLGFAKIFYCSQDSEKRRKMKPRTAL